MLGDIDLACSLLELGWKMCKGKAIKAKGEVTRQKEKNI